MGAYSKPALTTDASGLLALYSNVASQGYLIYGTVNEKGAAVFRPTRSLADISIRTCGATLPPKYIWYPPWEDLCEFTRDGRRWTYRKMDPGLFAHGGLMDSFLALNAERPESSGAVPRSSPDSSDLRIAIFGIRPCDVHALHALDEVFLGDRYIDPYYARRRRGLAVVAFNCVEPGDTCFCSSMGTGPGIDHDVDVVVTDLGSTYLFEAGSDFGASLMRDIEGQTPSKPDFERKEELLRKASDTRIKVDTKSLPELLDRNREHPYWDEVAAKCYACANCTSVCPTCYCGDIFDQVNPSLTRVRRQRRWSWCFLVEFAAVNGGNFRERHRDRLKQFMQHKMNFSIDQYGFFHCVGCGRCIVWCPANIDIAQTVMTVTGKYSRS